MIPLKKSLLLVFLLFVNNILYASQEEINVSIGHAIFHEGIGRDGRVIGGTLHGQVPVNGSILACAGCHGKNAKGGGEAFIYAPNITWLNISKPYMARRSVHAGEPYDLDSFARALRTGVASDGRQLDPAMPRIDLADDEIKNLVAYLASLDNKVSNNPPHLTVLGLLPVTGKNILADRLNLKLQNCHVTPSNNRIAAINILYYQDPDDAIIKLDQAISKHPNSIVLMPFILGWEPQYVRAIERLNIPTVLPLSIIDLPDRKNWFYRFPGLQTQINALLKLAKQNGQNFIRIAYNPNDNFSLELSIYSQRVAVEYGLQVIDETSKKDVSSSTKLWLIPPSNSMIEENLLSNELMLVPAFFFDPVKVDRYFIEGNYPKWRVAYPYVPLIQESKKWRAPIRVWTNAACAFLALLGKESLNFSMAINKKLEWENGLTLPARADKMLDLVYIQSLN